MAEKHFGDDRWFRVISGSPGMVEDELNCLEGRWKILMHDISMSPPSMIITVVLARKS